MSVNIGSVFAGDADAKTISSVGFDGNTLYVGGSGPNNYTTIQSAIDDAVDGDTVFVYDDSSPYYENVIVDKEIDLIGEDKIHTHINGTDATISVINDFVNIRYFNINSYSNGIIISNQNQVTITDCIFVVAKMCIYIDDGANNISISKNFFGRYTEQAIYLKGTNSNISNNIFDNIYPDPYGFLLDPDIEIDNTTYNTIYDNQFFGTSNGFRKAIRITRGNYHIIKNNEIDSYNDGIFIRISSQYNVIQLNEINNCNEGIVLVNECNFNEIIQNNFMNNVDTAQANYLSIKNKWRGNYWDRPRILPKAITGYLIPPIPWMNFDWRPALQPYDIGG